MKMKCGYPVKKWNDDKREVKAVLIERAKDRDIIPYIELTHNITAIQLEPKSFALRTMLREIAAEENAAGRGMLTALVVYNSGDMQPGPGFFDLAGKLGKNTNDILQCWIKEVKRVHACWSRSKGKSTACLSGVQAHLSQLCWLGYAACHNFWLGYESIDLVTLKAPF